MSESEFWAGVAIATVLFFGALKMLVIMVFPKKRHGDDETAYGDTGGWPKID